MTKRFILFLQLVILTVFGAGCSLPGTASNPGPSATPPPGEEPTPEPTPTEVIPLAAVVNGEGIRQTSFNSSLAQFQAAQAEHGNLLEPGQTAEQIVLDALIDRTLLAQAARAGGYSADQSMVEGHMAELTEQAGGPDPMNAWLTANGYTLKDYFHELQLEMEASWQRQQIVNSVPDSVPQVRARQIFFYNQSLADRAYSQLSAGIPFETIAANNDPQNLGYLDWFPRGVLFYPELEQVAFSLQPEQYSEVIQTEAGYHILQVLELDPDHSLSAEARLNLQNKALEEWLAQQRSQSQIEIYNP